MSDFHILWRNRVPCKQGGANKRGILSFTKESIPLLIPREKDFKLAVSGSNGLCASGMGMPARGVAALGVDRRFDLLLSSAAALPILLEVQTNFRLSPVSSMRRAKQCRIPHAVCRRCERHSRLTIVRRGCERQRLAEASWRSHVHRTHTAQRVQSFKNKTRNVGGRGGLPSSFLLGVQKGDTLFREREYPPFTRSPRGRGGENHFF